jgi:putative Mn2+ efflux pump MntP
MENISAKLLTTIHFIAAMILILIATVTMGWSVYEVFDNILAENKEEFIPLILQSVGAIIIAAAIIDVAQYMIEEEVFHEKELRDPKEARKTITKIMVIISIAVSIEGLVYIFKAGTKDLQLLLYPAALIFVSSVSIVALGIYQKLSIGVESQANTGIPIGSKTNAAETHNSTTD